MRASYYIEKYYPLISTILLCLALYLLRTNKLIRHLYVGLYNDTFLTTILSAVSIIFGFLLTAFSIICQSNSKPVKALHELQRFNELINYNKVSVKWMFYNIILTAIFLLSHHNESIFIHYDWFVCFLDLFYYLFIIIEL